MKLTAGEKPNSGNTWIATEIKISRNKIYHLEKEDIEPGRSRAVGDVNHHVFLIHCDEAGTEKLHFVYGQTESYWDKYYDHYKETGVWNAK